MRGSVPGSFAGLCRPLSTVLPTEHAVRVPMGRGGGRNRENSGQGAGKSGSLLVTAHRAPARGLSTRTLGDRSSIAFGLPCPHLFLRLFILPHCTKTHRWGCHALMEAMKAA